MPTSGVTSGRAHLPADGPTDGGPKSLPRSRRSTDCAGMTSMDTASLPYYRSASRVDSTTRCRGGSGW
jgi:hypothetical protein